MRRVDCSIFSDTQPRNSCRQVECLFSVSENTGVSGAKLGASWVSVMRSVTKRLRVESRGFRCQVACTSVICTLGLTTKLNGIPPNLKHSFGLICVKVKPTSSLGYFCSQISQLLRHKYTATNESMTTRSADDRTLDCGGRSAEYFDWRWIFVPGTYFYLLYFQYLWLDQHVA